MPEVYLKVIKEAQKYLVIGAIGFVIDAGLFNVLSLTLASLNIFYGPIIYKTISATIAITFTYFGNSRWTFKTRTGREPGLRRIVLYGVINVIGLALTVLPLYVSRYVLGFESLLADNISGNIIGVGLALVFRFVMNRQIVFLDDPQNLNNSQLR